MKRSTTGAIAVSLLSLVMILTPQTVFSHSAPSSGGTPIHDKIEVPIGQPAPTVKLEIHPDTIKGWNLKVNVTNFKFAPERVNQPGPYNEGHAHLYIDGKKEARLYSPWYYLETLPPGAHYIGVALTTNEHDLILYEGRVVADQQLLLVP